MNRKRIAVIGSGIAGLSAAWLLSRRHEVTLFEKNDYVGGHTHTIDVETDEGTVGVDTGFVVYNHRNYPELVKLFRWLGVSSQATTMSFSASLDGGRLEYAGSGLNTLFVQRRNLCRPAFLRMLHDILRFNRRAKFFLREHGNDECTLSEWLTRGGFGGMFRDAYLLPMGAAIWSCPAECFGDFPAVTALRFFNNHGLLDLRNRPRWRTVSGGSRRYVEHMLTALAGKVCTKAPVAHVTRSPEGVGIQVAGETAETFDAAVLACHADEALALLAAPTPEEQRLLDSFRYQSNRALLHSDADLMPRRRRVWSAWNYLADRRNDTARDVSVTYWMNRLQTLGCRRQFFVSLNPLSEPRHDHVTAEMIYQHPVFDRAAIRAQSQLESIQGRDRLWFCGSYFGYGFHEDAFRSGLSVAGALGATPPWEDNVEDDDEIDMPIAAAAVT